MKTTLMTWKQWRSHAVDGIMKEYNVSKADALDVVGDSRMSDWINESTNLLIAGIIPSQQWINSLLSDEETDWTWWKSFVKHHPDIHDRLHYAGRSLYKTKKEFEA